MPPTTELQQREYQVAGTTFLKQAGRSILADDAGLGKTNQLLLAAEGKTLIVSPAMLEDVWVGDDDEDPGEARRWRPDLLDAGLLHWTSYSSLPARALNSKGVMGKVLDVPKAEYRGHWDTVIFDEAHYLKGRHTTWALAGRKLESDNVFMATGTPLVNWAYEIFMLLQIMYPALAKPGQKYGNYWKWVAQWFSVMPSQWDPQAREIGDLLPGWTWEEFAEGNDLQGHWLRRERDDVLKDLPPLTRQVIEVPMVGEQLKIYRRLKKELYARIDETGHEIISWSKGGVWTKLLKLTTGIEIEDAGYTGHGAKMILLKDILLERVHPTLVFTAFRASAERVAEMGRKMGKRTAVISGVYTLSQRKAVAKEFRLGRIDLLVGTLGSIGEGLTLTAADTCIFLERDPRPSKNEQAVRRIHRFGQDRPCLAIDLVTKGSVDSKLRKLLQTKTDQQIAAMRAFDAIQLL